MSILSVYSNKVTERLIQQVCKEGYLSKHITIDEFTRSQTAARLGIRNNLTTTHQKNAEILCRLFLDVIRDYYNKPIIITSGYRCSALNAKTPGASSTSLHALGCAADFYIVGVSLKKVWNDIISGKIKFKHDFEEIIWEFDGKWIHIAISENPKKETLASYSTPHGVGYKVIGLVV